MLCKHCGNDIPENRKFCNRSCSNKFNNKNRIHTDSANQNRREKLRKKLPEDEIIELYKSGKSASVISKLYDCSRDTIVKILKRNNIDLRSASESISNGKLQSDNVVSNKNKICEIHNVMYEQYKNGRHVCKKCANEKISNYRRELKIKAVEYKGGKCAFCGYNKSISALEFHHTDPNEKDFGIATKGTIRKFEAIKKELDKCIMLCANCHREEHDRLFKNK
ncbi:hypothetical protein DQT32_03855 [Salmonella enterica subsp. enterica serovar Braenderup]|nr:hypothetical protein [Salmonella enterica subsp. enterica serovar Braenderup]